MTESTFDDLLECVARQTTRRAAVATLLGGALLLNTLDAGEATKEAERRTEPPQAGQEPLEGETHLGLAGESRLAHGFGDARTKT